MREMSLSGKTDPVEIEAPSAKGSMWVAALAPLPRSPSPPFHLHLPPSSLTNKTGRGRSTVRGAAIPRYTGIPQTELAGRSGMAVAENVVGGQQIQPSSSRPSPARLNRNSQLRFRTQTRQDVEIQKSCHPPPRSRLVLLAPISLAPGSCEPGALSGLACSCSYDRCSLSKVPLLAA